jgi:hypothetical protein
MLAASFGPLAPAQAAPAGWRTLTAVLPSYTDIGYVAISPDSRYAVFTADIEADNRYELYSVPITGSVPVKLNPPLVAGGAVSRADFLITPDSRHVIYMADQDVDQRVELYSVPIEGGPATKLNGPLVSGGNVSSFQIDADTGTVVYLADQRSNDVYELYSVPLGGGAAFRLNPTPVLGGDVIDFDIDPVSHRVVYLADQDTDGLNELYSVYLLGSPVVKLNPPISKSIRDFQIAPGAAYVMFIATAVGASADELYEIATPGFFGPQKRNEPLNPGENVLTFRISPAANQVVYLVEANNLGLSGSLWRVSPSGGAAEMLNEVADPAYGVGSNFAFTPDGQRVVYVYQQSASTPVKLQSARADGAPVDRLDLFVTGTDHILSGVQVSPDSQWAVFADWGPLAVETTLSAVPTGGGSAVALGTGNSPRIRPDSQRVLYYYLPPALDYSDLLSVQIFGGGQRNLTRMMGVGFVLDGQFSPDSQWVVFVAMLNGGRSQLRVSDGTEAPLVLNTYLPLVQK